MIASRKIDKTLKTTFMSETKKRKGISHPVIRFENGRFYLSVFAFFVTKEDVENNVLPRPEYYCLADIETGKIEAVKKCSESDFTRASFDKKYSINMSGIEKLSPEQQEEKAERMFSLLDDARQAIQETQNPDVYLKPYNGYMNIMLSGIPSGYRRFYKDLSRPTNPETEKQEMNYENAPDVQEPKNGKERKRRRDENDVDPKKEEEKTREAIESVLGKNAGMKWKKEQEKKKAESEETTETKKPDTGKPSEKSPDEKNTQLPAEVFDENIDETVAIAPEELGRMIELAKQRAEAGKKEEPAEEKKKEKRTLKDIIGGKKASKETSEKSREEQQEQHVYTYKDINWKPKEDLSILPDRYFNIANRIAYQVEFRESDSPHLKFSHPQFCFRNDTVPGNDPWLMMQLKALNTELEKEKYKTKAGDTIYTSCSKKANCLFHNCPYVVSAYINYLNFTDYMELVRQRREYQKNKDEIDAEGMPGYIIKEPKEPYSVEELKKARNFIDLGLFNVTRKEKSTDVFVVTYISEGKTAKPYFDINPDNPEISSLTSFSIAKTEIENGYSGRGHLIRMSGKKTPEGVDLLIYTDYLIKMNKIRNFVPTEIPDEEDDDLVTIAF